MSDPRFSATDVWRVAKAVIESWGRFSESHDGDRMKCRHCGSWDYVMFDIEKDRSVYRVPHKQFCPVLLAQDLLTGAPEEYQPNEY